MQLRLHSIEQCSSSGGTAFSKPTSFGSRASTMRRARRDLGLGFGAGPSSFLPTGFALYCLPFTSRSFLTMAAARRWRPQAVPVVRWPVPQMALPA